MDPVEELKAAIATSRPKLTIRQIAERTGVPYQVLHNVLNGRTKPRPEVLEPVRRLLREHAPVTQLLGEPMFPVSFPTITMRYAGEVPASSQWGDPLQSELPIEMEAKFDHAKRFVAKVVGDSCYPALHQGDLTVWHADPSPPYGLIVLAQRSSDQGCTVKQLAHDPRGSRPKLQPINPRYDSPEDGDGWSVIARLVAVVRRVDGMERTWYLPDGLRPRHLSPDPIDLEP